MSPCTGSWILTTGPPGKSRFPQFFLHFWRILGWLPVSFNTKYFTPLSSCLDISWREAQCIYYLCFSIGNVFSFSSFCKDFSFVFDFLKFEYDMIWCRFSGDFLFSSGWASWICESEVVQSCPTFCDLTDCSPPGFSVRGTFQARILEWVAISFSRRSSLPRDWTPGSRIVGRRFTVWATRRTPSEPPKGFWS